jgi:hypothetical protein
MLKQYDIKYVKCEQVLCMYEQAKNYRWRHGWRWSLDQSIFSRAVLDFLSFLCRTAIQVRRRSQHTHTHPYEYTYANPTSMSTFEGLSTGRSGDSRSHQWRLVVDGNVAYHLTHNIGKSKKMCE